VDAIGDIAYMWLEEDLEITASAFGIEVQAVFKDVLALFVSDTARLHKPEPDYAEAAGQLLDWIVEDLDSLARSFDLDFTNVFEDALRIIAADTELFGGAAAQADARADPWGALGAILGLGPKPETQPPEEKPALDESPAAANL
jgi:hypothetical protein